MRMYDILGMFYKVRAFCAWIYVYFRSVLSSGNGHMVQALRERALCERNTAEDLR